MKHSLLLFLSGILFLKNCFSAPCYSSCFIDNCAECSTIEVPFCNSCDSSGKCSWYTTDAEDVLNKDISIKVLSHKSKFLSTFLDFDDQEYYSFLSSYSNSFQFTAPASSDYTASNQVRLKDQEKAGLYLTCPHCSYLFGYECGLKNYDSWYSFEFVFKVNYGLSGSSDGFSLKN